MDGYIFIGIVSQSDGGRSRILLWVQIHFECGSIYPCARKARIKPTWAGKYT